MVLNLEVDWQVCEGHDHILDSAQLHALVEVFECEGILLNVDLSDGIDSLPTSVSKYDFQSYYDELYSDHWGDQSWCHALLVHEILEGHAGWYYYGGGVLIQNLKNFRSTFVVLHEFGHYLGLSHGGAESGQISLDKKPNYPSVMNYRMLPARFGVALRLSMDGLNPNCGAYRSLDFSHGLLQSLRAGGVFEPSGVGLGPVDWNCNGTIDSDTLTEILNLNTSDRCPVQFETHPAQEYKDFDDWSFIKSRFATGAFRLEQPFQAFNGECGFDTEAPSGGPIGISESECKHYAYEWQYSLGAEFQAPYDSGCTTSIVFDGDSDARPDSLCDPCVGDALNNCCCRRPGDVTHNGCRNADDVDALIDFVYFGADAPNCLEESDVDDSGYVDAQDIAKLADCVYYGGTSCSDVICGWDAE